MECSASREYPYLGFLPLSVGQRSPETHHPLSSPSTNSLASSSLITLLLSIGSKLWRRTTWISREKP